MSNAPLTLLVILTGMLIPLQPIINAAVAQRVGHPISAALVSVTITFACLAISTLAIRAPFWSPKLVADVPYWAFFGGLIGAVFLFVGLYATPKLGIAFTVALLIAGQMAASLAADHFGLFGIVERSISPMRVLGALLLVAGVILIRRF